MSIVFCNVGQCGNQLGYSVLESLYNHVGRDAGECPGDSGDSDVESFFRESASGQSRAIARAVCIDTEPKVVNECLWRSRREARWSLDAGNVVYRHGGAGNNWAMGYQMCSGDFLDASLNCIRRELESCHQPPLLVTTHSVAGGTGSGLGTHITEAVCDEYPDVTRLNIAITPYHFGEVVVQHYNTVLSLAKISSTSHAVLTFENEVAQELCKKMRKIERPSIADMNQTIAANIVPIMLPKRQSRNLFGGGGYGGYGSALHDDIATLCAHPAYRFLDVKTTPQTSDASVEFTYDSWPSLLGSLEGMHDRGSALEGGRRSSTPTAIRSIGSHLVLRGPDAHEFAAKNVCGPGVVSSSASSSSSSSPSFLAGPAHHTRFFANPNYATLLGAVQVHDSEHVVNAYQRSASLLSNGQAILPILQRAASKGAELFRVGAYLHQYTSCGLETDDFVAAFRTVGQVIESYNAI